VNSVSAPSGTDWPIRMAGTPASLVVVITLMAIVTTLVSGLATWIQVVVACAVLIYGTWQAWRLVRPTWHHLVVAADGTALLLRKGRDAATISTASSFVSPIYLGFTVCRDGRNHAVGLFREQLDPVAFRRLSVHLRQGGPA
jgi:hypothetical protein